LRKLVFRVFFGKLRALKFVSPRAFFQGRFPLAIVAGILLALAFPNAGVAGFAWIAPGLLLGVALGTRGGESFRLGYAAGLAHYLASLSWLLRIPVTGFPILGWVALSAFLALLPAAWVWLAMKISSGEFQISNSEARNQSWLDALKQLSAGSWSGRVLWSFSCAAIWVALEMFITRVFGGFPWNLLGSSQFRLVPLIQIASATGIYGVSFLVVWTSASLLCAIAAILGQPGYRSIWTREIILPFLAVGITFGYGFHRLTQAETPAGKFRVTLVQPSIPQSLIWNSTNDQRRFQELLKLSETALHPDADLLIWPEAALPKMLRYDDETRQAVTNLAASHRVWLITGSDDAEPRRNSA
jgi:apolipoprotein N-acyltransferase